MPSHPEASRLNLEYYRKQAKNLLKAVKSGDQEAAERLTRHVTRFNERNLAGLALHDAQLVIAREQGFVSWPRFRAFLEQSKQDLQGLVETFVDAGAVRFTASRGNFGDASSSRGLRALFGARFRRCGAR